MAEDAIAGLATDALTELLADPAPRVLHGSRTLLGIFKGGSQKEKAAAKWCLDNNWLEPTGASVGKGKSQKELYRLTSEGLKSILAHGDASKLLRRLQESVEQLSVQVGDVVSALQASLPALKSAISQLGERLKPPDLDELRRLASATALPESSKQQRPAATSAGERMDWGKEIVKMVSEQKQRNAFQRLTLTVIYQRLRASYPELTLGEFHDGLRRLQEQRRILLGPYTQALATLDDARNALYLDREVKYYVDLP